MKALGQQSAIAYGFAIGMATCLGGQTAVYAADLPVKAKAVEYVRICSLYGAGFYYVPGTDTCIKFGGYLRVDTAFNASAAYEAPAWAGNAGQQNRLANYFIGRVRQGLNIDTRTATEYGLVRTYFNGVFSWTTGDAVAGASLGLFSAFVQFAGFTMGRTVSQFDTPWSGYPGNNTSFLIGGYDDVTGVNQVSYTADFGGGVTGTASLEDPTTYLQSGLYNTSAITTSSYAQGILGANDYGGTRAPDIIGRFRVDQAWGLFQASVAAHNVHAAYYGATETTGHPSDAWGWAGQVALSIKNIPTGPGDTINVSASYANGASRYVIGGTSPNSFAMYGSTGLPGVYQSIGFGSSADGVFAGATAATGTGIQKSTLWGVRGAYTHNWNAYWNTSVFGSYTAVSWGTAGKALICAKAVGFVCNPDFNFAQIGTVTRWVPVKRLTFSGEVMYTFLDQKSEGALAIPAIAPKPAAIYELKDQGTWTVGVRAQRDF
ncbi:porin [Bradyrhizobium liaoningense]|uniref:porin n=1 Tax=Bradyrhizobium liaoningense TaxID=43992 RepID=UPI003908AB8B